MCISEITSFPNICQASLKNCSECADILSCLQFRPKLWPQWFNNLSLYFDWKHCLFSKWLALREDRTLSIPNSLSMQEELWSYIWISDRDLNAHNDQSLCNIIIIIVFCTYILDTPSAFLYYFFVFNFCVGSLCTYFYIFKAVLLYIA